MDTQAKLFNSNSLTSLEEEYVWRCLVCIKCFCLQTWEESAAVGIASPCCLWYEVSLIKNLHIKPPRKKSLDYNQVTEIKAWCIMSFSLLSWYGLLSVRKIYWATHYVEKNSLGLRNYCVEKSFIQAAATGRNQQMSSTVSGWRHVFSPKRQPLLLRRAAHWECGYSKYNGQTTCVTVSAGFP